MNSILSRGLLEYSAGDLIQGVASCICFRSLKTLKMVQEYNKHRRLALGAQKLKRELDVVKILNAVREVNVIKRASLSPVGQMLLKYQKAQIIQSEESTLDEDCLELIEDPETRLIGMKKLRDDFQQFQK